MRFNLTVSGLLILISQAFPQTGPYGNFKPGDQTPTYLKRDFSTLLIPANTQYGFIGNDYRRLQMIFTSIVQDSARPEVYKVAGTSLVGDNACNFKGSIQVQKIREYAAFHLGQDDEYQNTGIKAQGQLMASYHFEEDKTKPFSGIFDGTMTLDWVLDRYAILYADRIEARVADGFANNKYVGRWVQYGTSKVSKANWAEGRAPESGDLDLGSGDVSINPKYKNGWKRVYVGDPVDHTQDGK